MELRHLRHFLAVAETLNYSRAAERLVMAASPLSRSIQQLEHELGGLLFSRGTRRVELTRLGEALIPHAEKALADIEALKQEMHQRVLGHPEYRVGIRSVPPRLITEIVEDVIKAVSPGAMIRLDPLDSFTQMDRIINGRLTLGLVNRRIDDNRLDYFPVLLERAGLALPDRPEYAGLTEVLPEHLTGLRLLVQPGLEPFGPDASEYRDAATEIVHVSSDVIGGLSTLIAQGDSFCFTVANPDAPWHEYLARDGVVIRPLPGTLPMATTYLVWRADRDTEDDLGPVLSAVRARFAAPLNL